MRRPICLKSEPILEALCELRFSQSFPGASALLPGQLASTFATTYPKFESLATAQLPQSVRELDLNLKYAHLCRLSGPAGTINIADNAVSLSVPGAPVGVAYPGWVAFKARILELFSSVLNSTAVGVPERISIKYINILGAGELRALEELTTARVSLGGQEVTTGPLQLRTEFRLEHHAIVVQISNPAQINVVSGEQLQGLVLEVDTVRVAPVVVSELESMLEEAHSAAKDVFFKLISPQILGTYEPIYD